MDTYFPIEGTLLDRDFATVLFQIYKHAISGLLIIKTDQLEKGINIDDGRILFANSNDREDSLGHYLVANKLISQESFQQASEFVIKKQKKFGRALLELGIFNGDQLWASVSGHLENIIFSLFELENGEYKVKRNVEADHENITLDKTIPDLIVAGTRNMKSAEFLHQKFSTISHLYIKPSKLIEELCLKPCELHLLELLKKETKVDDILKRSELLHFDTLRILYMFLVMEFVLTQKPETETQPVDYKKSIPNSTPFTSYEEALKYYNAKYEFIYKILLKEIGPVSHSIICKSIEEISENLPISLQKIQFLSDGHLREEPILKSAWYHDFDGHITEFLKGLEDILFTEIHIVKKHLGIESEQQVLKWIKEIEN